MTIYDDGLDPQGLQVPFDFEGVPKQKVIFLRKGNRQGGDLRLLYGRTGGKDLDRPWSHRTQYGGPVPINLFMKEGDSSLEEMIRSIRKGIYVTRFHYTNVVEPMKAVITGMTRDGTFLIEEGEIKGPDKKSEVYGIHPEGPFAGERDFKRSKGLFGRDGLLPAFCNRHGRPCHQGGWIQLFGSIVFVMNKGLKGSSGQGLKRTASRSYSIG